MRTTLNKLTLFALLSLASTAADAEPRYVTQTATLTIPGGGYGTNVATLQIGQYEVAELVASWTLGFGAKVIVIKDGIAFCVGYPCIVAGPAELRTFVTQESSAFSTWKILPASYPPDRAVLVAPGTNQTQVTLECSTNLVNWFTATNGVYGPLPEAKFFRIKADPALPH